MVNFNVKCNEDEKPGYYFDIDAVGEFRLEGIKNIDNKFEQQFILYTALLMVINSVRTFIQTFTAMHAFDSYLLPSLDLGELIDSKFNENGKIEGNLLP